MACSECISYGGNCPCCEEETKMVECTECGGTGMIYFDEQGKDVTREEYERNPRLYSRDNCDNCEGSGEVEDVNGYTYDDYLADRADERS